MINDPFSEKKHPVTPSEAAGLKIKYKGACELSNFYKYARYWLEDNGFLEKGHGDLEIRYTERIKPDGKKNLEIRWEAERNVTDMFKYNLTIVFFIVGIEKIEVEQNGEKRSLEKAAYEVRIWSDVETDPKNKLKNYGFLKRMYFKYVVRKDLNYHKSYLYNKTYEYQEAIKNYLREYSY